MNKNIMLALFLVFGLIGSGNILEASSPERAIKNGTEHFKIFCANCHGPSADGKGALVEAMKISPSDLTVLNKTGDLSIAERVLRAVSGQHDVPVGQKVDMPLFSHNLESITIYEIVLFLKTIQK
ncbi:MAG: hypothetical protein GY781_08495 [Gammaproteobacteria bacterium]|nr:hypothetical protein [Gammaproteobacteria bacterium]